MIEALKRLQKKLGRTLRILYLCNSTDLRDKGFSDELKKWGMEEWDQDIDKMCYQTAYKKVDMVYDLTLGDEFDFGLTPKYSETFRNNNLGRKILVSATLTNEKREISEEIAPIIYKKELQEIEDRKVLNKSTYYFVNYLMTDAESERYVSYNKRFSELILSKRNLLYRSKVEKNPIIRNSIKGALFSNAKSMDFLTLERKRFLNSLKSSEAYCKRLILDLENEGNKILIFCELTDQADKVSNYSYHNGSSEEYLTPFIDGKINKLAVCGKINRGVNIPGVNNIIFESCNSSKPQLIQRLGRGKRLSIDKELNVYFLIPYYKINGKIKPTKIYNWIYSAAEDLNLGDIKIYKFKSNDNKPEQ